jgi:hypothetical protein
MLCNISVGSKAMVDSLVDSMILPDLVAIVKNDEV